MGKINTDAILESGYIEELIEYNPFLLFPTVTSTEKPDKITAKLLEGRAAILVDGTPFVLTVPYIFSKLSKARRTIIYGHILPHSEGGCVLWLS